MKDILEILHNKILYYKEDVEVKKPLIELAKEIESHIEQNYYEKGFVECMGFEIPNKLYQYWKDNIRDKQ